MKHARFKISKMDAIEKKEKGAIQVLRNAIFLQIGPPPTPS